MLIFYWEGNKCSDNIVSQQSNYLMLLANISTALILRIATRFVNYLKYNEK